MQKEVQLGYQVHFVGDLDCVRAVFYAKWDIACRWNDKKLVGVAEDVAPVHVDAGLLCTGGVQGWPSDGGGCGGGSGGGVVNVGVQGDLGGGNGVVGKDVVNAGVQ
jgi:hypothetical protein